MGGNVNDINKDASGDVQVDVKTMPPIAVVGTSVVTVATGHVSLIGTSPVSVVNLCSCTQPITGNVTVMNLCSCTQPIAGNVYVLTTAPISVEVDAWGPLAIASVTVDGWNALVVAKTTGYVTVQNWPATQVISGSISLVGTSPISIVGTAIVSVVGTAIVSVAGTAAVTGGISLIGTSPVTGNVDADINPLTSIAGGRVTVGTATAKILGTATCKCVSVEALSANTGIIYVGTSGVSTAVGWELAAPIAIDIDNANKVYVIANQAAQKVCWMVLA